LQQNTSFVFASHREEEISLDIRMIILVYEFYMGRKSHFRRDEFMDAAMKMAAEEGPGALTVSALAKGMNAPIGSVYHRFLSRDVLLAETWLRIVESFQREFLETLAKDGLQAALNTIQWVREHPREARILLVYRREELVSGPWPEHLKGQVVRLSRELDSGIRSFTKRHFGNAGKETLRRATFSLVDVPLAAARRHLQDGESPPAIVDEMVRETYLATMESRK
jgi:AcrR family transcriptional regulator